MVLSQTFLSLLFITISTVDASPLIHRGGGHKTLSFLTTLHARDGRTLLDRDRAHAHAVIQRSSLNKRSDATSVSITNAIFDYVVEVGVGKPPSYYTLAIDTGSSNTWVGANSTHPYVKTQTSVDTGDTFNVTYGSGNVFGEEWIDTVTLSSDLVIKNQSLGAASSAKGFEGVDGILGVGPADLTVNKVNNTATVPTVMDNLYSQGKISEEVLGIYFVPSTEPDSTGELTFGGYDSSVITSSVEYVPLTKTFPALKYWGVNQTVSYGDQAILRNGAGIVDTGTTLVYLATDAFEIYQKATGGVADNSTGLLAINAAQYANLKPLTFDIGGVCLDLTPNAQIWPRSLNAAIGGEADGIYLVIADLGTMTNKIDFIDGYVLLERFYSVFDTTNQRIGFAKTAYTESLVN